MFEFRTDVATLQPARRMEGGRLVVDALITKPGIFEYADSSYPGGIRRELRPDAEVYSKATMDSFSMMPCTSGHPPMLLNGNNTKQYSVGATGEKVLREQVNNDSDWLKSTVMVSDAKTIQKMEAGDQAVSCGYACRIDETPGVDPKYGAYHVVQRDIIGNHLAVAIPAGRAGRLARVRMDSELTDDERTQAAAATNVSGGDPHSGRLDSSNRGEHNMNELEQLRASVKALEAGLKASEAEAVTSKARADAAEQAAGEAKGALKTLEQERDALKTTIAAGATAVESEAIIRERARADEAEAKVSRFDEALEKKVEERSELQFQAATVMGGDFKMRGLTDRQIIAAVVKRLDASADVTEAVEDSYLRGRFDSLLKLNLQRARQNANVAQILGAAVSETQQRADSSREQKREEYRNQAKRPLSELLGKKGA